MSVSFRSHTLNSGSAGGVAQVAVTKPAGAVAGDVLLVVFSVSSGRTVATPDGWLLVRGPDGTGTSSTHSRSFIFRRVIGGSDPASWDFGIDGSTTWGYVCGCYIGVSTSAPIDVHGAQTTSASSTVTHPAVTATVGGMVVALTANRGGTAKDPPAGFTSRGTNAEVGLYDKPLAGAGSAGPYTSTLFNAVDNVGTTVVLASANAAPNAPTSLSPAGGGSIDKDATQRFSWTFSDPDAGDAQSAYDLRYRVVGTGTWTTVSGGNTQYHDFAGGTFAAGDWEWQVRTTDNGGLVGPYSASAFFTAATAPTAPGITDPINNGTVSTDPYMVQWTAPAQDAYQVRTVADAAGSPDTGTVYQDTGTVESATARARSMPFPTNGRTEHVQVRVRSAGLWSSWASVKVNVSYTAPPTPTIVVTAQPLAAAISLTITNPAPVGSEPAVVSNEVHVRVAAGGRRDIDRTVGGDGIRIAVGIATNGAYTDRAIGSGIAYEYRVKAIGENNVPAWSVWTD